MGTGFYPLKKNCWSAACKAHQKTAIIFIKKKLDTINITLSGTQNYTHITFLYSNSLA